MPRPRGPTGSVRGLPAQMATDLLVELVEMLAKQAKDGRTFVRHEAAQLLRKHWELEGRYLDGMILALERIPGIEQLGGGVYRLPPSPIIWATNRTWRFSIGRLSLADAQSLYRILMEEDLVDTETNLITHNLRRQTVRLRRALASVFGDGAFPPIVKAS